MKAGVRPLDTGTFALVSDHVLGGYRLLSEAGLVADAEGAYYAGKIVLNPRREPVFLATLRNGRVGGYQGVLSDPAPVRLLPDGGLTVQRGALPAPV